MNLVTYSINPLYVASPEEKGFDEEEGEWGKRGSKICAPSRLQQADASEICVAPFDSMHHAADPSQCPVASCP